MSAETGALPEVELRPGALFVGDAHLDVWAERAPAAFLRFLDERPDGGQLVVLGDLFDAWIGPGHAAVPAAAAVCDALVRATRRGVTIDVVVGNRDFLLDADFERRTGARVRPHGLVLSDGPRRILAVHGDELCTLDRPYQRMKRVLRSAPVRWVARTAPARLTLAIARRLRRTSGRAIDAKPPATLQQQPAAARELARRHRADVLVCGHAHRYRDETIDAGRRWIVLDAFGGERDVLRAKRDGVLEATTSGTAEPPAG